MESNGHGDHGLSMDLGSAMDVDVGVGVGVGLDVNVGHALNAMDNQMPLDVDLFGDPLHMQEMPAATVSKQLQQRLDELRSRGCCQYVSLPYLELLC
jgi:mediator of RNA polymerase II transcription subunit 16